jgi:signal transduction histidine kinase
MPGIRPRCGGVSISGAEQDCVELVTRLLTHESRTPLNAIVGFTELLLAGGSGQLGAEAKSWVAEIAQAARDLEATLVAAGVLIELGLLPARSEPAPVALAPLLRQAGFELLVEEAAADGLVVLGTVNR